MAAPPKFQSLGTRLAILACFWIALLLSVPSWLRLTTIQRLPLPTKQIAALQLSETCPVTFKYSLTVLIDPALLPQGVEQSLDAERSFLQQVAQLVQQSLELKAEKPIAASLQCTHWTIDVQPTTAAAGRSDLLQPEKGRYVVRVSRETSPSTIADQEAQQASLPTVYLPLIEDPSPLPLVPDTVSAAVIAELLQLRGDKVSTDDASNRAVADTEQDPRVIQYSKHIRLVFSIMNQDVTDTTAYDSYLIHALASENGTEHNGPVARLRSELGGLHDFHVETQVQWFAPLHFRPTQEVLEEVVEREVDEVVMVDEEIEEEVEVEIDDGGETEDSAISSEVDLEEGDQAPRVATDDDVQTPSEEEKEVEAQLETQPQPSAAPRSPAKKRRQLVRQKRTIQVPRLQRVVKQTRTPLPPRHVVEWDDLKVFVNSEEWALTSTVPPASSHTSSLLGRRFDVLSQTHDLHFLLYIPSRSHSPLLIRDPSTGGVREGANAWLIPQWGGVVVVNAEHDEKSTPSSVDSSRVLELRPPYGTAKRVPVQQLPQDAVEEAIGLFARQLEILLGLSNSSPHPTGSEQDAILRNVRIAALKQRRILELAREATTTLQAITRLVDRIENLGVGPDVKSDTEAALAILTSLPSLTPAQEEAAATGAGVTIDELLHNVAQAFELSNRAFFNPDMLGLLYFPDEHKYAVYTPLFAPLLVPLFVTSLKLLKELKAALVKRKRAAPKGKGRKSK